MSVQAWAKIPDNPRQRNTEKRARFAKRSHLAAYSPIHRFVYAASVNGNIIKLNKEEIAL
jgi:hypothetical protein